jgi:hypothetical protein
MIASFLAVATTAFGAPAFALLSNYFFKALNFNLLSSYSFWGHMYPY